MPYQRWVKIIVVSVFAILATAQQGNSKMNNRSQAVFTATVLQYANYLYLSELFKTPTAMTHNETFCGDIMSPEEITLLKSNIDGLLAKGFWALRCSPTKPVLVRRANSDTFDFSLKYLKLPLGKWIDEFKAAALSHPGIEHRLMPVERQLFLSRAVFPELKLNAFSEYGKGHYLDQLITRVGKASKNVEESGTELIGVIKFSNR